MHNSTRSEESHRRTKVGSTLQSWFPLLLCAAALLTSAAPAQTTTTPAPTPAATPVLTTPASPGVESIRSLRDTALAAASTAPSTPRKKSYSLTVTGDTWLDTGLSVTGGETIAVTASGTLALPDGRSVTPDGLDRGWKDLLRQFPLNQAKTGQLLGRVTDIGASVPFALGSSTSAVMPTSGRLYLRANLSDDLSGTGSFSVTLKPEAATAAPARTTAGPASATAPAISSLVSPALFSSIPRRVSDQAGDPGDMVNFALLGSQTDVTAAFANAGWVAVDRSTGAAVVHGLLSTLSHQAYTEMPMSTLFLFGRPQDLSFARADPLMVAAERHHLRVWNTGKTLSGRPLWVGSATHDIGFERDQRNGGTTHKIDPNVDLERTFLLQSFDAAGNLSSAAFVTPADPLRTANTATGGSFSSDGRILILDLKPDLK